MDLVDADLWPGMSPTSIASCWVYLESEAAASQLILHFSYADAAGIAIIPIIMPRSTAQIADDFIASSPSELSDICHLNGQIARPRSRLHPLFETAQEKSWAMSR
jgi:hypothetical protein